MPGFFLAIVFSSMLSAGSIIGTNPAALSLTAERISHLPSIEQPEWTKYLERSQQQLQADQEYFFREMKEHGVRETSSPPAGRSGRSLNLRQPAKWYAEAEGLRIAEIVMSFQTPAGGWSKNLDMAEHRRKPGERFSQDAVTLLPTSLDNDTPRDRHWNYVGTFDNDATIVQLRYLAKVVAALGTGPDEACRASFLRGMNYIFAAQFPNGGWPQVWPLQGEYHDAITFNDDAMIHILGLLSDVAQGKGEFAFVPQKIRARAEASCQHGIECILHTQISVNGRRTVWCQQHDPLTLKPAPARNYEMPSQCGSESARIALFLMGLPNPNSKVVAAVHASVAWFEKTKLRDVAFKPVGDAGRQLVSSPGSVPLWARYYEIGSDRPIFGDRDKTIHDDVNDLSKERRNGYSWFNEGPSRALEQYLLWRNDHPGPKLLGN